MKTFEAEWRARFERFARTHANEAEVSGWSEAGLRRRVMLFTSLLPSLCLPPGARVLELGCGAGTYVQLLAGLGHRPVGLDYSLPSLSRARAADPEGRYLAADAYSLPFGDQSFDLVMSIGVLQTLSQPERALDEMTRLLRGGGLLLVEALNGRSWPARAREAHERVRGRAPRVRAYDPLALRQWLLDRGLHLLRQSAVCLPPRQLPRLGRVLDSPLATRALAVYPAVTEAIAHAFWFVARRPAVPVEAGR